MPGAPGRYPPPKPRFKGALVANRTSTAELVGVGISFTLISAASVERIVTEPAAVDGPIVASSMRVSVPGLLCNTSTLPCGALTDKVVVP